MCTPRGSMQNIYPLQLKKNEVICNCEKFRLDRIALPHCVSDSYSCRYEIMFTRYARSFLAEDQVHLSR